MILALCSFRQALILLLSYYCLSPCKIKAILKQQQKKVTSGSAREDEEQRGH